MIKTQVAKTKTRKKAIVLSGGSIRGAFQAGALSAILKSGYQPDIIQGISSGALNGLYVASEAGRIKSPTRWEEAGDNLRRFWMREIKKPKDIALKRNLMGIFFKLLFKNYKGLVNPKPLQAILDKHIDLKAVRNCPATFLAGAVNMLTGDIEYKDQTEKELLKFVLASASMPLIFPPVSMNGQVYYDGGIRDNAPLRQVIRAGADEIILILTQADPMEKLVLGKSFKPGKALHLIERTVDILLNDVLVDDLKELQRVNRDLEALGACMKVSPKSSLEGKRKIKFKVIRPQKYYEATISKFDQADVHQLLMDGYQQGIQAMHRSFETGTRLKVQ